MDLRSNLLIFLHTPPLFTSVALTYPDYLRVLWGPSPPRSPVPLPLRPVVRVGEVGGRPGAAGREGVQVGSLVPLVGRTRTGRDRDVTRPVG